MQNYKENWGEERGKKEEKKKKGTLPVAGNDNKEKGIRENNGGWLLRYPTGL